MSWLSGLGFETVKIKTPDQDHIKNWDLRVIGLFRPKYRKSQELLDCWEFHDLHDLFLQLSRTWLSRLGFWNCPVWDSWLRPVKNWDFRVSRLLRLGFKTVMNFMSIKTWFCNCQELLAFQDLVFETVNVETLTSSKIETLSYLDCWNLGFKTVMNFSTVKITQLPRPDFETVKIKTIHQDHIRKLRL